MVGWLLLFLHLQILSLSLPFKSVGLRTNFLHFCYYGSFRHPAAAIHKVADYEEEEGGRTDVFSLPPPLRAATTAPSFLPSFTHFWQFMVGGRGWSYSPAQSAPLVGGLEEMGARFMHSGKTIGRCFGSGAKCTCIHFLLFEAAFALGLHDEHALALGFQLEKTVASSAAKTHWGQATLATLEKRTTVQLPHKLNSCFPPWGLHQT